jgi:hypothetical protein
MAERKAVTGRQRSTKLIRTEGHSSGWDLALDKALAKLSKDWGTGEYKNVHVDFRADISVTNPGSIDTYIVQLLVG